jgi:hypothetical protein
VGLRHVDKGVTVELHDMVFRVIDDDGRFLKFAPARPPGR